MSLSHNFNARWFKWVHGNNLIYNTCWEDPRLDRVALELSNDDTLVMITSAGCNALDYVLQEPKRIHAVDMNAKQNAVLELKIASIRQLDYEDFFQLFGNGWFEGFEHVYHAKLRGDLSPSAQAFWDKHLYFFTSEGLRNTYYFHGTSGYFAWLMSLYLKCATRLREGMNEMLAASSVEEQQNVCLGGLKEAFWNGFVRFAVGRDTTLSLLGVPQAQREQVEKHYTNGIAEFMEECIEAVFTRLPLMDNYFWRVYLTGHYTKECCPTYLVEENFQRLKDGLVDRITIHTNTVQGFLEDTDEEITRYVLLDHMDWLASYSQDLLQSEWQAIVDRAAPTSRLIWRSGGVNVDYVDPLQVKINGSDCQVGELLTYHQDLAEDLHQKDRVHTYGSFYIADMATA